MIESSLIVICIDTSRCSFSFITCSIILLGIGVRSRTRGVIYYSKLPYLWSPSQRHLMVQPLHFDRLMLVFVPHLRQALANRSLLTSTYSTLDNIFWRFVPHFRCAAQLSEWCLAPESSLIQCFVHGDMSCEFCNMKLTA